MLGPARRQGISRTALAGFDSALPVIYSAQASEAAVSPCRLALVSPWLQAGQACGGGSLSSSKQLSHRSTLLQAHDASSSHRCSASGGQQNLAAALQSAETPCQ